MTNRLPLRRAAMALIALPLALGLVACGKSGDKPGASGEPLAKVAAPAGKAWQEVVTRTADGGYLMGNPDAPIKLMEFGSLSCPHCARFSMESTPKLAEDFVGSGRVSYEYRSFAIHPIDVPLTMMVNCGAPESSFALIEQVYAGQEAMMTRAMEGQEAAQKAIDLPDNQRFAGVAQAFGLIDFFAQRGISVDQAKSCLAKVDDATQFAKRSNDQGTEFGIEGTPTFFINGSKIEGNTWDVVKAQLETAGAR